MAAATHQKQVLPDTDCILMAFLRVAKTIIPTDIPILVGIWGVLYEGNYLLTSVHSVHVRILNGSMAAILIRLVNVRVQRLPELQVIFINVRSATGTGHPTNLLRYSTVKVWDRAVIGHSL